MPIYGTYKIFCMETEKYTEKLARYTLYAAIFCLIAASCWYFRSVLVYILVAVVISLLARPITDVLKKLNIKGGVGVGIDHGSQFTGKAQKDSRRADRKNESQLHSAFADIADLPLIIAGTTLGQFGDKKTRKGADQRRRK